MLSKQRKVCAQGLVGMRVYTDRNPCLRPRTPHTSPGIHFSRHPPDQVDLG